LQKKTHMFDVGVGDERADVFGETDGHDHFLLDTIGTQGE